MKIVNQLIKPKSWIELFNEFSNFLMNEIKPANFQFPWIPMLKYTIGTTPSKILSVWFLLQGICREEEES